MMRKLTMPELNRMTVEEFKVAPKVPIVIVLDNIRSQNNIGSVFRTADAFRLEGIWLCGITATPPHREIHKTALGATDSVDWHYCESTLQAVETLRNKGYTIIAVEQAGESIMLGAYTPAPAEKFAIIFGNEVEGIGDEIFPHIDTCLEIPQYGTKHSINISVAVGIVIWELAGRLNLFKK
jgi:tRNA G18 (ribose-2'-O)-methylase SpoU